MAEEQEKILVDLRALIDALHENDKDKEKDKEKDKKDQDFIELTNLQMRQRLKVEGELRSRIEKLEDLERRLQELERDACICGTCAGFKGSAPTRKNCQCEKWEKGKM